MDESVGLAGLLRPRRDQRGQLLAGVAPPPGVRGRRCGALRPLPLGLLGLVPAQQGGHLLRFEQARDPQEVGLLVGSDFGAEPEFASVEERPVEGRVGSEGLEAGEGELVAGLLLPVGPFDQIVVQAVLAAAGPVASSRIWGTDGRNTVAVSPRLRARTKRPIAWAKNSGVEADVA